MSTPTEADILKLLRDDKFEKIQHEMSKPNIFSILKIDRMEIRHSNFLGWMLNPNGNHGLRDFMLKPLLRDTFSDPKAKNLSLVNAEINDFGGIEVRREWKNIDLLIILSDIVVCIENKVKRKDHKNQLKTYKEVVTSEFEGKHQVFIYLTPFGEPPNEQQDSYINYSYESIAAHLDRALKKDYLSMVPEIRLYLSNYLLTIKRRVLKQDPMNKLVAELYSHHKETLDFIFDNKPDATADFQGLLEKRLNNLGWKKYPTNKTFFRFVTPALEKIVPQGDKKTWKNKELLLFEIVTNGSKKVFFKVTIARGTTEVRKTLNNALNLISPSSVELHNGWIAHLRTNFRLSIEEFAELDPEEQQSFVDTVWEQIVEIVEKVEKAILKEKHNILPTIEQN